MSLWNLFLMGTSSTDMNNEVGCFGSRCVESRWAGDEEWPKWKNHLNSADLLSSKFSFQDA